MNIKDFSLKFIDFMVAVVLGLGFQWWPNLHAIWQYVAFIFVYFDVIDYWVDYSPSLKKFPPKRELDLLLDLAIIFSLFLYIYATQLTITYFLSTFVIIRVLDVLWLLRAKAEYHPTGVDRVYVDTWINFDSLEAVVMGALAAAQNYYGIPIGISLGVFISFRLAVRITASLRYRRVYFI